MAHIVAQNHWGVQFRNQHNPQAQTRRTTHQDDSNIAVRCGVQLNKGRTKRKLADAKIELIAS